MDAHKAAASPAEFLDGVLTLDRRPLHHVPGAGDELIPVMRLLDEALATDEAEPPMRSADGWPVEIRDHAPIGMHELTSESANDGGADVTPLPPPKMLTLMLHTLHSMALLIENYIAFFKDVQGKDGKAIRVLRRLPATFVSHFLHFDASCMPRVSTLVTAPLVLPNGRVLATNGLDRELHAVFRIDPATVELTPVKRPPVAAIAEAMAFLTDEWLVDVQTDYAGKCVLIALALTIIERAVFGERPAFFVTSGKRGGGKTTALNMVALATLGKRASAMAWSRLEEERRKAIFAAFLQGVPLIVFDNIARGATLTCPVVEKAITAAELEDRVLKESRNERVACTAPMAFTGNNILPKGDLASRTLMTRITVDRPDPENRSFRHPDPCQWTLDHRGQILEALYTLVVGNPRLYGKRQDEKTRFKEWQRMIGSAIEHAAKLVEQDVDFGKLFSAVEAEDEETASLAEAMEVLDKWAKDAVFKSADVFKWASGEDDDGRTLKAFFGGKADTLTTRGITYKLKAAADAPTPVKEAVWTLRVTKTPHADTHQFAIQKARREGA
jgi:hypothetical protein